MMDIINYDKIKLEFEDFSLILPSNIIEKFQIEKVEQLIEKKYAPEDIYNVYVVINRVLAEEKWKKEALTEFNQNIRQIIYVFDKYKWYATI